MITLTMGNSVLEKVSTNDKQYYFHSLLPSLIFTHRSLLFIFWPSRRGGESIPTSGKVSGPCLELILNCIYMAAHTIPTCFLIFNIAGYASCRMGWFVAWLRIVVCELLLWQLFDGPRGFAVGDQRLLVRGFGDGWDSSWY